MSPNEPDAAARAILNANDRGGYTVPNGRVYPFQWNWDSAFVALGFDTFDRAWTEIETVVRAHWADGFLPHIVFWKDDPGYFPGPSVWSTGKQPVTSGITQPPVAATSVRKLWESAKAAREGERYRARLEALLPKLLAWHRWFAAYRDFEQRGVVVAIHGKPGATIRLNGTSPANRSMSRMSATTSAATPATSIPRCGLPSSNMTAISPSFSSAARPAGIMRGLRPRTRSGSPTSA